MKSDLPARVRSLVGTIRRRGRFEAAMDEEMRFHVAAHADDLARTGLPPAEAQRRARLAFGAINAAKEDCRRSRGVRLLDELGQDIRYAVRSLAKTPGFTAGALLSLALGIGANAGIFTILKAAVFDSLMFKDADRLVTIWTTPPRNPDTRETMSVPEYAALTRQTGTFERVGGMLSWAANLGATESGVSAERLTGQRFTGSLFEVLGVAPERGRTFSAEESVLGSPETAVVLSHRVWQNRFGGDPDILKKTVVIDGSSLHVVGIMPPGFGLLENDPEFWIQMNFSRFQLQSAGRPGVVTVVGRLAPGVSIEQAQQQMNAFAAELERTFPASNRGRGLRVQPLDAAYFGNVRRPLIVLQGVVALVLLIACANVGGLLLIRATSRQQEIAIRSALGGGKRRLARQFLTESLVLSLAGGAAGIALAWVAIRLLVSASPSWLSLVKDITIDVPVLAFTAATSLLTGLAFGVVPALQQSRSEPAEALKGVPRGAIGGRDRRQMQRALVTAQIALTLALLIGAGLVIKSFLRVTTRDLGFSPSGLLSFQTRLPANQYFRQIGMTNGLPRLEISPVPAALFNRVFERLQQIPGVESVAGIDLPPLNGAPLPVTFTIEGRAAATAQDGSATDALAASHHLVTPNFFRTMGAPLIRGRDFTAQDTADTPWVAVISQALADQYWPGANPIGQRLLLNIVPEEQPREIVGIAGNMPLSRLDHGTSPAIYTSQLQQPLKYRVPYGQSRIQMTFLLRLAGPIDTVVPLLRRAVADVDSRLPVSSVQMVDDYLGRQVDAPKYYMLFLGAFGGISILLAALGVYGIVAYSVAQRGRELAVRMALGAHATDILALVVREAVWLTAIGIPLGIVGALLLTRFLASVLWEVTATDPVAFAAALVLLPAVALAATLIPASRVLRLNPGVVLGGE
jgi:predicted permease